MVELVLEHWPIDRLQYYARNPRKNDHAVDQMAAAIVEFGFRIPIIALSSGLIVDGHLRVKAARQLGLAEVPVVLADDLTETQIKALRLLMNRSASWAAWDDELLRLELADLQTADYDLSLTGFDDGELDRLLAETGDDGGGGPAADDEVPEPPVQPVSRPGDLWVLGNHRLLCGDSTNPECVQRLMNGYEG